MPTQQILPAVSAAIFNDHGEILLQKRRDVNKWCIICGHVEFGETIEQAILREIEEETNAKGEIIRFIGIYSSPESQTYNYENRNVQYVTSYFQVKLLNDLSPEFSNNETQQLKFFETASIPSEMAQISPHWLQDALDKNNRVFVR